MTGLLGKAAKCRKNYLSSWAMIVCRFINAVRGQAMQERGEGRVIFIASEGGKSHVDGLSIYNSMKSAVIGLTRNLSHEFAGTRVSFVAVLPGAMLTDSVIERMCALPDGANYPIAQVISRIPARRGSLPEEVANKVGFLATEAGAYVQAACVSVGGGLTSW
jgi:2-hydroxycyclohexanecarboxyl-CoA dehydrogenase